MGYRIYVRKENDGIRIYGCGSYTKQEYSRLVDYWNLMYPNNHIEPVQ